MRIGVQVKQNLNFVQIVITDSVMLSNPETNQ